MGSTVSKDNEPDRFSCSIPEKKANVEPWKATIVAKLKVADSYRKSKTKSASVSEFTDEQYHELAAELGDVDELAKKLRDGAANGPSPTKKITWKLVLTALPTKGPLKSVLNVLARNQQYGVIHVAVQIGAYLVDYNNSGLVEPRLLKGSSHYAALDLTIASNELSSADESVFTTIAQVIVDWNRSTEKYDRLNRNCQHFVDDLFKRGLGVSPKWPPAVEAYMVGLREDSDNGLPHYIDEKGQRIFFGSHKQLDDYIQRHRPLTRDQECLMKAFDRGYMIRWKTRSFNDIDAEPLNPNILSTS